MKCRKILNSKDGEQWRQRSGALRRQADWGQEGYSRGQQQGWLRATPAPPQPAPHLEPALAGAGGWGTHSRHNHDVVWGLGALVVRPSAPGVLLAGWLLWRSGDLQGESGVWEMRRHIRFTREPPAEWALQGNQCQLAKKNTQRHRRGNAEQGVSSPGWQAPDCSACDQGTTAGALQSAASRCHLFCSAPTHRCNW